MMEAPSPANLTAIHHFYHTHGFVHLPGLIPADEVAVLHTQLDELVAAERRSVSPYDPSRSERALLLDAFVTDADYARVDQREDLAFHWDATTTSSGHVLRSINNLVYSEVGARLARDERIVDAVAAALGDDALGSSGTPLVRFFNSRCFVKPAGGAGTAWHRDIRFFNMVDRADGGARTAINALLLLDTQTAETGALRVVPGSHTNKTRRGELDLVEEFGAEYAEAQARTETGERVAPPIPGEFSLASLPVGTLVLVDHFTLHGSSANVAVDSRRRMLSLGFAGPHVHTIDPLAPDAPPAPARNIAVRGAREPGEVADYLVLPSLGRLRDEL